MKKIIIIILFFVFYPSFGQTENLSKIVLNDILKNTYSYSKPLITNKLDSTSVEYHLKRLIENKKGYFVSNKNSIDKIKLTKTEQKSIITDIRKQYSSEWKKEDFENFEIINDQESLEYLKQNNKNTLVTISKPIFLRNDEIAFVFFANYCCLEYGRTE